MLDNEKALDGCDASDLRRPLSSPLDPQSSILDPPLDPPLGRIVILRALNGLGDMLCATPALRALRRAFPAAQIAWMGLPWAATIVGRYGRYLDELIEFPGFPGIPEREVDVRRLPEFFRKMHSRQFDLALQMQGCGIASNQLAMMLGARHTAGFYLPGQYCPDPERFLAQPFREPEVRRFLRLLEFLGIPSAGDEMEFPVSDADRERLCALDEIGDLGSGKYACIHPGASLAEKRWPAERFAAVADRLVRSGLAVVLTGAAGEAEWTARVARAMEHRAINLAGRTDLGMLAALIQRARILVANDTGVSHLSAAVKTPSVIVFTRTDPARWAPPYPSHRALGGPVTDCPLGEVGETRCLGRECLRPHSESYAEVAVDAVVAAVDQMQRTANRD